MGLVVRDQPKGWSVKSTRFHEPNLVICEVVFSGKRTSLIGAHLSSFTLKHLLDLEEFLK